MARSNSTLSKKKSTRRTGEKPSISSNLLSAQPSYARAPSMRSLNVITDNDSDQGDGQSMLSAVIGQTSGAASQYDTSNLGFSTPNEIMTASQSASNTSDQHSEDTTSKEGQGKNSDSDDGPLDSGDKANTESSFSSKNASPSDSALEVETLSEKNIGSSRPRSSNRRAKSIHSNKSGRSTHSMRSSKSNSSQTPIADRFAEGNFAKNPPSPAYSAGLI